MKSTIILFWLFVVTYKIECRIDGRESSGRGRKVLRHSGRLLGKPDPVKCSRRPRQYRDGSSGHYYFFSEDTSFQGHSVSWLDARNLCRERCMDLISMETPEENLMVQELMVKYGLFEIWTSGRLCNFHGCDQPHLKPKNVNGWFWSGSGATISATNSTPSGWTSNPWSKTGFFGQFMSDNPIGQPDNAEFLIKPSQVTEEACLAVHNNWYDDGISWHDVACYHKKPFVCEDSDQLMRKAKMLSPNILIR